MNERDTEVIQGLLDKEGYKFTDDYRKADVILFNTCSVRRHAEDRVISLAGECFKRHSRARASKGAVPLIGILGCMAKNYGQEIFGMSEYVDFSAGPGDIDKVPGIIGKLLSDRKKVKRPFKGLPLFSRKVWETEGVERPEAIYRNSFHKDKRHAYVIISEGCSNFCAYCIVPYVRGPIRHRSHKNILKEVSQAIDDGITSITLLGQNVNSYRDANVDFIKLLSMVNAFKGLKQLNFMTSHPKDASLGLFKAIAALDKVEKSIHLPVQSGSSRVLSLMNRGYSREDFLGLLDKYRKIVKGGKITTDIIVGFPTETEADFRQTLSLISLVRFNAAYIFKYSPRPHTESFKMQDDVTRPEKERRHALALDEQIRISKDHNARK